MYSQFQVVLILLLVAIVVEVNTITCNRNCSRARRSLICATQGSNVRLFRSRCEFENAQCTSKPGWRQIPTYRCWRRVTPMPRTTTQTGNQCSDMVCMDLYDPVCGYDGTTYNTFSNSCYMGMHNCMNGAKFVIASKDKCNIQGVEPA